MVYKAEREVVDGVLRVTVHGQFDMDELREAMRSAKRWTEQRGLTFGAILLTLMAAPRPGVVPGDIAEAWLNCAQMPPLAIVADAEYVGFYRQAALILAMSQPTAALLDVFSLSSIECTDAAQHWCRARAITWRFEAARSRR